MRYLCLVYGTEGSLPVMQNPNPMSRAEVDAIAQDSFAYNDKLRKSGHFIIAHALQSVRTATTVRVRDGEVLVTDGPPPGKYFSVGPIRRSRHRWTSW